MSFTKRLEAMELASREGRSHSAQGLTTLISSPCTKFPQPPRLWITDISDDTTDDSDNVVRDELVSTERSRVRSRFRHHKQRSSAPVPVPIGIFWDIENCQVPRGCSAIDVVSAIRAKFLTCRREADFVVVCDVRKESAIRLQELNDAQVSLIHVCGTQKNAADEKLRQCMRRFGELHTAPASLLLISGDINFAADLSDFRHRKNMEVILVHKQNTSSALITCATTNYCFNNLTANLPRNSKVICQEEEEPTCEVEVLNLPIDQPPERVSRRLRRLGDNCGGKVLKVTAPTATLRFPSIDHASRALKRMEGEDVFGCKIGTRYVRNACQPAVHAYSSDEGYATATQLPRTLPQQSITPSAVNEWALALQQLPIPPAASRPQSGGALNCSGPPRNLYSPQVRAFCPPASKPRKIRGIHGSSKTEQSGCSSGNSGDDSRQDPESRAISPWNSSASFSEPSSEGEANEPTAELTVSNLPALEPKRLQEMLTLLISQYVPVVRVSVWVAGEGPIATVMFRSEWDARLVIARLHKRRLDSVWTGRRLELSLGRPSPAPNLDVLRARLRAILLEQKSNILPLLRLRDAYASRHCCALTTSDIAKVKDTVIIHEGLGRMVQLIDLSPVTSAEMEEAPWKCHVHAAMSTGHDDGSRILSPVYMEVEVLAKQTQILLENHGGILPLLSFVECYEATFSPLPVDVNRGVALELLLRSVPGLLVVDMPSRHITRKDDRHDTQSPTSQFSDSGSVCVRERPRTAPALEPMLSLFEREVIDLLRTAPKCCIPFSKLIPAFHHHFGRQCRVADYGFTKLPDLLAALSSTIVILGSGSSRVITISGAAQSRRWTSDLIKVLRSQSGRSVYPHELPALYQAACGRPFATQHYGVCTLRELMARVAPGTVICSSDGSISLPRRAPTPDERARVSRFAVEAVELLCYTPNLRMEFSRLVPAYHAHFGRQLRVAHYGCVKLAELFEMMPEAVSLTAEGGAERVVKVAEKAARAVVAKRLRSLGPLPVVALSGAYSAQFGAPPLPDMLGCAASLQQLVVAAGGAIEGGLALPPGTCAGHVSSRLTAAAVLAADRSVTARGSSDEYFARAFQRASGRAPDMRALQWANVIIVSVQGRVQLTPAWRTVWRLAQLLANAGQPLSAQEMHCQYLERYEPVFPCHELGFESVLELVRYFQEVFNELPNQRFSLCPGVAVMDGRVEPQPEITLQDTPPGQKGSRVFESPMTNIWCSPPASALPAPSALFFQDAKRRTRLAAQFNAA